MGSKKHSWQSMSLSYAFIKFINVIFVSCRQIFLLTCSVFMSNENIALLPSVDDTTEYNNTKKKVTRTMKLNLLFTSP